VEEEGQESVTWLTLIEDSEVGEVTWF